MFYHAFDGYMEHAFPRDELKPLSCEGEDTLGGYALTLVRKAVLIHSCIVFFFGCKFFLLIVAHFAVYHRLIL